MDGALVFHLISSTRPTATTGNAAVELQENLGYTVALIEAAGDGCLSMDICIVRR